MAQPAIYRHGDDHMNEAGVNELKAQRNNALDLLANANAAIADLREELDKARSEIAALKTVPEQPAATGA